MAGSDRALVSAAIEGNLPAFVEGRIAAVETAMMAAARATVRAGVGRLRVDVVSAGLGQRVANTWRSEVYPKRGRSMAPAGYIYSRASAIVSAFEEGATIRPVKGSVFLWLPTEHVPRRGGRRLKPEEVENSFNIDLDIVPSLTRPGVYLAVLRAIRTKSRKGFRQAKRGELDAGKNVTSVPMFVLVRQVRLQRRLDGAKIRTQLGAEWLGSVSRHVADALDDEG
ncbi:DUF6441 family protein [Methylobrevis pamukkalensis]|uniref:Uncharacterized protein n=1 Tax=Methylobrevis pamukkalensis TaxID=1439726 RepID=A0A1E3H336_9HYPH|nr:DUF6441 family protein [Methylobrevis pamukkalensis]ODN70216.1 hypothetical protein A6302_02490 [Methylobrevis pamukkalensis]